MTFRETLLQRAAARHARLVFAEGEDPRVLAAVDRLRRDGIAEPIVIGGPEGLDPRQDPRLAPVAEHLRGRRPDQVLDGVHALDLASDPVRFAAGLVALGEADGAVAGAVHTTADVIRAALWCIGTAPGVDRVSSSFYMAFPDGRVLTYADCAVSVLPSAKELAQIALVAVADRRRLVGDDPRVAFLSFSTRGSAQGPAVERIRDAVALFRAHAPDVVSDGELQADAALDPGIARRKAPDSPVGGAANVLIFPSLDAGNIAYKLTRHLAGAVALGPLLQGLARPMSDLSRGAGIDDIVEVAAMVALQTDPSTT